MISSKAILECGILPVQNAEVEMYDLLICCAGKEAAAFTVR